MNNKEGFVEVINGYVCITLNPCDDFPAHIWNLDQTKYYGFIESRKEFEAQKDWFEFKDELGEILK